MSPNATDFDPFVLDEVVVRMCELINLNGGFQVKGWYKPSLDDEGAANDLKRLHFCHLQPSTPLNFMQLAMRTRVAPLPFAMLVHMFKRPLLLEI